MKTTAFVSALFTVLCKSNGSYTEVDYTDNGFELKGYVSTPLIESSSLPAVVVVHNLDHIDSYELTRIEMISEELGYVGFAADVYGVEFMSNDDIDRDDFRSQASFYRDNMHVYASRIQAAVNATKALSYVDPNKVAIIGYCFGGTGVLGYALVGMDDVVAVVSFHGGLSKLFTNGNATYTTVYPKVLVQSGGDDDTSTEIKDLEDTLNDANATWEITRYSQVEHAFTQWDDDRYNLRADQRSWEAMSDFLRKAFGQEIYESRAPDSINVQSVDYKDDGVELQGFVAVPPQITAKTGDDKQVGAVVVLPNWDGVNEYEQDRIHMIANELGYVGFAADIFGPDTDVSTFEKKVETSSYYKDNVDVFISRIQAAVHGVQELPFVDPNKIAIFGYCFGGTGALAYALSGLDDVAAVVSFHGGLTSLLTDYPDLPAVHPMVLMHSGGNDDMSTDVADMENKFNFANATWEITRYSQVVHSFTNFYSGDAYDVRADDRSWRSTQTFLEQVFASIDSSGESSNSDLFSFDDSHASSHGCFVAKVVSILLSFFMYVSFA